MMLTGKSETSSCTPTHHYHSLSHQSPTTLILSVVDLDTVAVGGENSLVTKRRLGAGTDAL
jgi:hypothetical protein